MRKGVTGLQNIQLLKWCAELGVEPSWNFIWGFPGEPPEEYERLARLVPLLTHLPAPVAHAKIRLDRFSPNFFDAERLGFTDVKPMPAYAHVYPLADSAVANLASYFTYAYAEPRDVEAYTRRLTRELEKWKRAAKTSALLSVEAGEHLVIVDMRSVGRMPFRVLSGLARLIYRECDAVGDLSQLARAAAGEGTEAPATEAIEQLLAPLVDAGLLLRDGSRCLALAIPVGKYVPPAANRRFATIVRELGARHEEKSIVPLAAAAHHPGRRGRRRGAVPPLAAARFSVDGHGRLVIERAEGSTSGKRRADGEEERSEETQSIRRKKPETQAEAQAQEYGQGRLADDGSRMEPARTRRRLRARSTQAVH